MEHLNVDEIMALQGFGMRDAEIRKLYLDDFDRMLEKNPDLEDMLDKANIKKMWKRICNQVFNFYSSRKALILQAQTD